MVNFFIRVVFLAEPDDFEIMKSRKKRLDFHMSEYILHVGDHIGLFLFKRTFLGHFLAHPPDPAWGAPVRPGIDSARSLDLLGIVGDDAEQVPVFQASPGPCKVCQNRPGTV